MQAGSSNEGKVKCKGVSGLLSGYERGEWVGGTTGRRAGCLKVQLGEAEVHGGLVEELGGAKDCGDQVKQVHNQLWDD